MKFRFFFLFVLAICLTINASAQSAKSEVYDYSIKYGKGFNECEMDSLQRFTLSGYCKFGLSKSYDFSSYTLFFYISALDKNLSKWCNSTEGYKACGLMNLALSDGTKIKCYSVLRDLRKKEHKGTNLGAVSIEILISPKELLKVTKYNIESMEFDGSTLEFFPGLFDTAPTLASMHKTLMKKKNRTVIM